MAKSYHRIRNAYDAWWFLHDHPLFTDRERSGRLSPEQAGLERRLGHDVTEFVCQDGSIYYQVLHNLTVHAINENLSVDYQKVDDTGYVNKDRSKNTNIECWLEFGPYHWTKNFQEMWHDEPVRMPAHDYRLDCGAPTFDEAIIKLARLVKRHYGDYEPHETPSYSIDDDAQDEANLTA